MLIYFVRFPNLRVLAAVAGKVGSAIIWPPISSSLVLDEAATHGVCHFGSREYGLEG